MKGQNFRLNGNPDLLVAQELRYQRQIEPLACAGSSAGDLRHQFVPQRTKIGPAKRHRRELGKPDPIRAERFGKSNSFVEIRRHSRQQTLSAFLTKQ
jgi:hypothetical protein